MMMQLRHSGALALIIAGLAVMAAEPTIAAGSDGGLKGPPVAALSMPELRLLCRDENTGSRAQPDLDASAIAEQYQRSRAACDRLVEGSGLRDGALADALLDRADREAPGQDDDYGRALADYARAIALVPGSADAYWRRGKANLLYSRDLDAAQKDLDEAIRLDPSQAELYVTRASILGWLGEPDRALTDLNQALSYDPRSVHALTNRGLAYANDGDTSRAIADFDAALTLSPDDPGLYGFRAAARRDAKDEIGAKADEEKMADLMFRTPQ